VRVVILTYLGDAQIVGDALQETRGAKLHGQEMIFKCLPVA